jgi:hypothetical protein
MSILASFGIVAVLLMLITLELVRLRRLKERYAAIWVAFAVLVLFGVVFPGVVGRVSAALGFELPVNLVITGGIIALAFVAIQLSVDITRLRDKVDRIANRLALVELENKQRDTTEADPPDNDVDR